MPEIVVKRAVEIIRATAEADVDDAAAGAAVLRVIDVGLDFELLRGVGAGHEAQVARLVGFGACVGDAVEEEFVGELAAAVNGERIHAAVVKRPVGSARQAGGVLHGRGKHRQHERVAAEQRHLGDLLRVDHLAARRRAGFEKFRRSRHDDPLGDSAQFELEVNAQPVADPHLDVFAHGPLEPFSGGGDRVPARRDERRHINAGFVGLRRDERVGSQVSNLDRHPRHHGAGGIRHSSVDRRAELLPGQRHGCQQQEQNKHGCSQSHRLDTSPAKWRRRRGRADRSREERTGNARPGRVDCRLWPSLKTPPAPARRLCLKPNRLRGETYGGSFAESTANERGPVPLQGAERPTRRFFSRSLKNGQIK